MATKWYNKPDHKVKLRSIGDFNKGSRKWGYRTKQQGTVSFGKKQKNACKLVSTADIKRRELLSVDRDPNKVSVQEAAKLVIPVKAPRPPRVEACQITHHDSKRVEIVPPPTNENRVYIGQYKLVPVNFWKDSRKVVVGNLGEILVDGKSQVQVRAEIADMLSKSDRAFLLVHLKWMFSDSGFKKLFA